MTHPVQTRPHLAHHRRAQISELVTKQAYEVYCHLYGKQEAMMTGDCRGGFSSGELIAFLYAHTFPKDEWRARFTEALEGMEGL